ncbi:hypothetical protein LC55x_2851 [Lysobacter capsici]|nr:hypothetical protein LC55x_2851 [Lysobacter capsici]
MTIRRVAAAAVRESSFPWFSWFRSQSPAGRIAGPRKRGE